MLQRFIEHMFEWGGNFEFQIADVCEHAGDPIEKVIALFGQEALAKIDQEASQLRSQHGDFYICKYRE